MFHMKQLTDETLKTLNSYVELLYKWNDRLNLTSYTKREFYNIALVDCRVLLELLKGLKIKQFADVGTGYGLPGVVLKILDPSLEITLIDVSEKKIAFLEYVSKILKLDFEIFKKKLPDKVWDRKFEVVVSKASMKEEMLIKVARQHLKKEGKLIYYHGKTPLGDFSDFPLIGKITYKREDRTASNILIRKGI